MKKVILAFLIFMCAIIIAAIWDFKSKQEAEDFKETAMVEAYLEGKSGEEIKVLDFTFRHYEYGITGGLYMYHFTCANNDGKLFEAYYESYSDLSESTVSMLEIVNQAS